MTSPSRRSHRMTAPRGCAGARRTRSSSDAPAGAPCHPRNSSGDFNLLQAQPPSGILDETSREALPLAPIGASTTAVEARADDLLHRPAKSSGGSPGTPLRPGWRWAGIAAGTAGRKFRRWTTFSIFSTSWSVAWSAACAARDRLVPRAAAGGNARWGKIARTGMQARTGQERKLPTR